MTAQRTSILLPIIFLGVCCAAPTPAVSGEVYRWVDENGVVNFSDQAPVHAASSAGVDTVTVDDAAPASYDPEEDIYNVAAQAERMQALREQMEKEREAGREQRRAAPPQTPVQYPRGVNYGYPVYPLPPGRPPIKPPGKPRPPVPELYETSTLRPPGQSGNR